MPRFYIDPNTPSGPKPRTRPAPANWPPRVLATPTATHYTNFLGFNDGLTKGWSGMLKVKARGNETVEQMLRRFKKLCEKEGLIKDMKRIAYYEKPSERNRRQLRKAQKREQRTLFEANNPPSVNPGT